MKKIGLTAIVVLSVMILTTVVLTADASLGLSRWTTISGVLLSAAVPTFMAVLLSGIARTLA